MGKTQRRRRGCVNARRWMIAALLGAANVALIAAAEVTVGGSGQSAVFVDLGAIDDAEAADRQLYGVRGVPTPGAPYPIARPDTAPAVPVPAPSRAGAAPVAALPAPLPAPPPAPLTQTSAVSLPLNVNPSVVVAPDPVPRPDVRPDLQGPAGTGSPVAGPTVTVAPPPSPLPSQSAPGQLTPDQITQGQAAPAASPESVVTDAASTDPVTIVLARDVQRPDPAMFAPLAPLVEVLTTDESRRIRIDSVATDGSGDPVRARHLALRRALAARSFLIDAGMHPSRIVLNVTGDTTSVRATDQLVFTLLP